MKAITVYTPTYNRAFCLHQVYDSLLKQDAKDFKWIIIDDGSSDNTKELVDQWIAQNNFEIRYVYKSNGGMLSAHNSAHAVLDTELCVCIDSDDFVPDGGIQTILNFWNKYRDDQTVAGIVGLDCYKNGNIIGDSFTKTNVKAKYSELSKVTGDKKFVYRSSVIREFGPYPVFEGEKFPAQDYLYRKIDSKYDLIATNEIFCVVEYLPDGNSFNKISSYLKNPNGFMMYRVYRMETESSIKEQLRHAVHYVSSCLIAKKFSKIFFNRHFYLTIPVFPIGLALYFYLKRKKGGSVNKKLNT